MLKIKNARTKYSVFQNHWFSEVDLFRSEKSRSLIASAFRSVSELAGGPNSSIPSHPTLLL